MNDFASTKPELYSLVIIDDVEILYYNKDHFPTPPHFQTLGQDILIDLESELIEALDDLSGRELRHPVVVHHIDVIGAGLVEAVVLAGLVPGVIVGLIIVDSDPRLARELLDEVVAE